MAEEWDREQRLRIQVRANEFLEIALIRLMLLDPEFAEDARLWLDSLLDGCQLRSGRVSSIRSI
jgi:hypothetical protein